VNSPTHLRKKAGLLATKERWASGTIIKSVSDYLESLHYQRDDTSGVYGNGPVKGYAFSTHPTHAYISIGAWFAMGNHGNGGENAKGSSKTMDRARVLNMRLGSILEWDYKTLRRKFDSKDGSDFCIIDVSFQNLLPNFMVQKSAMVVNDVDSANEWLVSKNKSPSYLRVLFQGAARDYSLGLRWQDMYEPTDHVDPHCCSVLGTWVQVDAFSVWLGWREPLSHFNGKAFYRDANRWVPLLLPIMETYVVWRGYINFEISFKPGFTLTGIYLDHLTKLLRQLHTQIGGRSEIRYGTPKADQVIFLDCVFTNSFQRVFDMLHQELQVIEVALHPGKYHPNTKPCTRVELSEMYGFTGRTVGD
jgi:hypothetical protein